MLQPSKESRPVFLLHRDKFHAHALFGFARLHDGVRAYFPSWYVKQQPDESSERERLRSTNVQPTQPEIDYRRDDSPVGSLPGQNRSFWSGESWEATKVVRGRHGIT
jgi:hypothetical protein